MNGNRNLILWILGLVVVAAIAFMVASSTGDGINLNATSTPATTTTTGTGSNSGQPTGGTSEVSQNSGITESATLTLALGQEGSVGGVTLKPTTVVEDSRCPSGVQCVQAGTFRVNVIITSGGGTFTRTMELGVTNEIVGGQTLALTSVSPAAFPGGTPSNESYRLTFTIRQ
jgi:hypothetical protein